MIQSHADEMAGFPAPLPATLGHCQANRCNDFQYREKKRPFDTLFDTTVQIAIPVLTVTVRITQVRECHPSLCFFFEDRRFHTT